MDSSSSISYKPADKNVINSIYAIDVVFILVLIYFIYGIPQSGNPQIWSLVADQFKHSLVAGFFIFFYFFIFELAFSKTPGMLITQTRVVHSDGSGLRPVNAFKRSLMLLLFAVIFALPFTLIILLIIVKDNPSRLIFWIDKYSQTKVVEELKKSMVITKTARVLSFILKIMLYFIGAFIIFMFLFLLFPKQILPLIGLVHMIIGR